MAIWMDLTHSLYAWRGGVVGIVRAELEIAKNLHKHNPDIRFSMFDSNRFIELDPKKLNWLWESENIGDAYLEAMGRKQSNTVIEEPHVNEKTPLEQYPKLAEAYNFSLSRLARLSHGVKLYLQTLPKWIGKPLTGLSKIAFFPLKKISLARAHSKERKIIRQSAKENKNTKSEVIEFSYPYKDDDILFSCGWFGSGKEWAFSRIKYELRQFTLIYLIYDTILMLPGTKHFYHERGNVDFLEYFRWSSFHCDYMLYGGKNAMKDSQEYQKEHYLPMPKGFPVKFGSDITDLNGASDIEAVRKKYKISQEYLLMVGSLDLRKNYNTIYRAYTILIDEYGKESLPDLVIVGKGDALADLNYTIKNDPRTKDKIIMISPDNQELDCLYKNCLFSMLASSYEGWSLTLPEALSYHKLCIVSDVPPLREVGEDFVEYVDTYDPFAWAEQIRRYTTNRKLIEEKEDILKEKWHTVTWEECGLQILDYLKSIENIEKEAAKEPTLFLDLSTTWNVAYNNQNISGIPRTEIMLTYYLFRKYKNVKCFSWPETVGIQPVYTSQLMHMLGSENPTDGFIQSRSTIAYINDYNLITTRLREETDQKSSAFWYICSILPPEKQKKFIEYGKKKKLKLKREIAVSTTLSGLPFKKGDIIFSAGTGHGKVVDEEIVKAKEKIGFKYCQIIYDFTPFLIPQTHQKKTVEYNTFFYSYISKMADLIFYGGANAQKDGTAYQKKENLPTPPSLSLKFGSNIVEYDERTEDEEKEMLKNMSIKGPFILIVGTCEARKNHETIYRAYLRMLEKTDELPQIVFAGNPGWNSQNFFNSMWRDERVKDKILTFSPSDVQLDLLYKKCMFTILPSLYEGWSLTLPESFQYGKFCLCCDNPALRETGRDLVEYIHPWDEVKWAERIMYYIENEDKLKAAEERIRKEWKLISWSDCADAVAEGLKTLMED